MTIKQDYWANLRALMVERDQQQQVVVEMERELALQETLLRAIERRIVEAHRTYQQTLRERLRTKVKGGERCDN